MSKYPMAHDVAPAFSAWMGTHVTRVFWVNLLVREGLEGGFEEALELEGDMAHVMWGCPL